MNNTRKISRKIEKIYKRPIDNLYSLNFFNELFTGYSYSLNERKFEGRDFFNISPKDSGIEKLFNNSRCYDFSNSFEQTINSALYSMAVYGKAYIFIRAEYTEKTEEKGNVNKVLKSLDIHEVKGVLKNDIFYYKTYSKGISYFTISEGSLIILDLKELGYKRNYFTKLIKKLGTYDVTSDSLELINNEPAYDFNTHVSINRIRFLKKVSDIGWEFGTDGLSESYILYKEIKMKLFKKRMLQYVLEKINEVIVEKYVQDKDFRIEAMTGNIDYEEVWNKFQSGELTVTDLSKIVWRGI